MSLDYRTLKNKKYINIKSNFDETESVKCIDLLSNTINRDIFSKENGQLVVVEREYIARPDLISLALYNTDEYTDIICKINAISNPFELNEGMVLMCPSPGFITSLIKGDPDANKLVNNPEEDTILSNKTNTTKKSLDKKRSPVDATIFDNNYTIVPGVTGFVFY